MMRRRWGWGRVFLTVGFFVCLGFMLTDLVLWDADPQHPGICLFGAIWCGVVAIWMLFLLWSVGR